MITVIILILIACVNLPHMIMSKKNYANYIAFGFCLGLSAACFIDLLTN